MLGLLSSGVFGFIGATLLEVRPVVAWVLLGLAAARLALAIREFSHLRARGDDD